MQLDKKKYTLFLNCYAAFILFCFFSYSARKPVAVAGDEKSANAPSRAPATQPRTLSAPSSFAPAPQRRRRTATPTAVRPGPPGASGPTAAPAVAAATVGVRATACWRETAALAATAK